MNGKKAKLLRKLARMNVEDQTAPFKSYSVRDWTKSFLVPAKKTKEDGSEFDTVQLPMKHFILNPKSAGFIYRQMKATYHQMRPLYRGMRSQKIEKTTSKTNENTATV